MIVSADYTRWINASMGKWFDTLKGDCHLFIEGQPLDIAGRQFWAELRLTGPRYYEWEKNHLHIELDLDIMCCALQNPEDQHLIHRIVGRFQNAAHAKIPVKKYGKEVQDDDSQIGCFVLRDELAQPIETMPWGVVLHGSTEPLPALTTSLQAFYKMDLNPT